MKLENSEQVLEHFRVTDSLLEGHFILSSGRHSAAYLQSALALQFPKDAAAFGHAIAGKFLDAGIETVCSPAIGGLVVGYETARALNVRFVWTERKEGEMLLRRGFTFAENEKVLVVEDVITTGGSTRECIAAVRAAGADVVAAAVIIDRSAGAADVGVPLTALAEMLVPSYSPENCPLCEKGVEAVKPGSRV